MHYIIMDLEWNNAYSRTSQKFINEIIEIGAVKLDEKLNVAGTFSQLVKPVISNKLRARIKDLTHITNDEIRAGKPFADVIEELKNWSGNDCIFMTWGDTDIRTMLTNFKIFLNKNSIDFIEKYADLQKYCQRFIDMKDLSQAGLSYAAECLNIDPEQFPHHRALDDSRLSAECFKKVFNSDILFEDTVLCDGDFYARLVFKPFYITDKNDPLIDKGIFNCYCDMCGAKVTVVKDWKYGNQSFRGDFYCENCNREFRVALRIKKNYDYLDVKRRYFEKIRAKTLTQSGQQDE